LTLNVLCCFVLKICQWYTREELPQISEQAWLTDFCQGLVFEDNSGYMVAAILPWGKSCGCYMSMIGKVNYNHCTQLEPECM
jgi:hypothetical protein